MVRYSLRPICGFFSLLSLANMREGFIMTSRASGTSQGHDALSELDY